jgi:hypothetical protein
MAFASDYTKSPEQILIDLINNDNTGAFPMTTALIGFGAPSVVDIGGRNTEVVATAKPGSGYTGSQTFHYNRVDMANIPGVRPTSFQKGDATNLSDLIAEINVAYGINLTVADFVDVALPTFDDAQPHETQNVVMAAAAGSLVWVGQLTLTIDANDIALSSVLTTTELNGLVYTPPAA